MESTLQELASLSIQRARRAQKELERLSQQEVDRLAFEVGRAIYDHAPLLAAAAVEETGMGNVPDKIIKKQAKAETTWTEIKDQSTVGLIRVDHDKRMLTYADPIGVVAGVAPCTNPVATAMFYSMICLKTRNALILSPHPRAIRTTLLTLDLIKKAIHFAQLPDSILQVINVPELNMQESMALTQEIMSQADLVIATGGPRLVDAAYHSGTPAYGVGAGNTPVFLHPSADIDLALEKIIAGRAFDNGIVCSSEQHLVVPHSIYERVVLGLHDAGAYYVEQGRERERLQAVLFDDDGRMRSECVGKSAAWIAERCGLSDALGAKVLVVPLARELIGQDPFSAEKLCPVLSLVNVPNQAVAIQVSQDILNFQGKGHSAAIHIDEKRHETDLRFFAERMPATHIIVNMSSATSSGGSRYNWITPSTTLGCGAYGRTIPMETINLGVKQLINYKAVAMPLAKSRIPEGIFARPATEQHLYRLPKLDMGYGLLQNIDKLIADAGYKSILLVSGAELVKLPIVHDFQRRLAARTKLTCFTEVTPDPSYNCVETLTDLGRKVGADCVIGLGGGSVIDAAKAAAAYIPYKGHIADLIGIGKVQEALPIIAIPTTAGTGSEVTPIAVLTDPEDLVKKAIVSELIIPVWSILDTELTLDLPPNQTAYTGLDALSHAIEAFLSKSANASTDFYARAAIRLILPNIRRVYQDPYDRNARQSMQMGAYYAGIAFANAGVTAAHAFSYPLGARHHLPHGLAVALMLPSVIEYDEGGDQSRLLLLAQEITGKATPTVHNLVEELQHLAEDLGVRMGLEHYGVKQEELNTMASEVLGITRILQNNPRPIESQQDSYGIYQRAFHA